MKNTKLVYGHTSKTNTGSNLNRRFWPLAVAAVVSPLAGCLSTPHTTIEGSINGSPFRVKAPKDGDLTGFDLLAETNGAIHVHIDHLAVKMNPDVISQTGAAQTGIIKATGEAASGITAAAVNAAIVAGAKSVAP
ncbi:MAG: hypothetical protein JWR26_2257 [Pedosphaera sp.]|nr:hypothetical protein [Pedosphaera sp.]